MVKRLPLVPLVDISEDEEDCENEINYTEKNQPDENSGVDISYGTKTQRNSLDLHTQYVGGSVSFDVCFHVKEPRLVLDKKLLSSEVRESGAMQHELKFHWHPCADAAPKEGDYVDLPKKTLNKLKVVGGGPAEKDFVSGLRSPRGLRTTLITSRKVCLRNTTGCEITCVIGITGPFCLRKVEVGGSR
jgi:hypothetical protein